MRRVEADGDWSLFDPEGRAGPARPVRRGVRARATREAEAQGSRAKTVQGARPLRAHDAHAGADRQRLDDVQGQVATAPATRRRCPGARVHLSNLCTEILEVTSARRDGGVQPGSINLARARRCDGAFDFEKLARTVRTAVRQLDRVIDLNFYPIATARALEHALAPGRPRRDGPAGRVLPAAPAVRRARGARAVDADRRGDLLPRAVRPRCELARENGRAPGVRGDARRARRAAVRRLGRDARGHGALGRAARADPASTACATRC